MIPGMNPRDMARAMKKLGMKQEELDAKSVVITLSDKQLVFENPQVMKIDMMGQETYQLTGSVVEKSLNVKISEDDVQTVMDQSSVDHETALKAIKDADGDLASAILNLQQNQD
ncbi:nascent polypeptide-associated complex protein [Candidatus Woesearchaeota archaeon CG10_big_fil_rev_8_21_14_0_10_30_7]|nr:MAG: nascent polypeptide-associated complex protein [Candidatus Woesearchaeota archaeon CG10_big_fil_rev_8_21_14_0_10_30_7]